MLSLMQVKSQTLSFKYEDIYYIQLKGTCSKEI